MNRTLRAIGSPIVQSSNYQKASFVDYHNQDDQNQITYVPSAQNTSQSYQSYQHSKLNKSQSYHPGSISQSSPSPSSNVLNGAHRLFFKCNEFSRDPEDNGHIMFDANGNRVFDIVLYNQANGTKTHCVMDQDSQTVGAMTVPPGARHLEVAIETKEGTYSGVYNPRMVRHSKATLVIAGVTYCIKKSRQNGQKLYYWAESKRSNIPLVIMGSVTRASDFTFTPACPEELEKAIALIRSHHCATRM